MGSIEADTLDEFLNELCATNEERARQIMETLSSNLKAGPSKAAAADATPPKNTERGKEGSKNSEGNNDSDDGNGSYGEDDFDD